MQRKLKTEKRKIPETKEKKVHLSLLKKKPILPTRHPGQVKQQITPPIEILIQTYQIKEKKVVVKRKRLEFLSVQEKVMLRL